MVGKDHYARSFCSTESDYVLLHDQENLFGVPKPQRPHWGNWIDNTRHTPSAHSNDGCDARPAFRSVPMLGCSESQSAVVLLGDAQG